MYLCEPQINIDSRYESAKSQTFCPDGEVLEKEENTRLAMLVK